VKAILAVAIASAAVIFTSVAQILLMLARK